MKNSILPKKDPPEGKTTAIIAVMGGRPKHGHHRQRSNKHYKQKLVQVLYKQPKEWELIPEYWLNMCESVCKSVSLFTCK